MRHFIVWPGDPGAAVSWIAGEHARYADAEHFTRDVGGRIVPQDELEAYARGREMLQHWRAGDDRLAMVALAEDLLSDAPGYISSLASMLAHDEDFSGIDDIYCETLVRLRAVVKEAQAVISAISEPTPLVEVVG